MSIKEKVSITISIAKSYRDRLRTMAAQQNLYDPDQLTSASTLAREIICEHIDELERVEADFIATNAEKGQKTESGHFNEAVTEKLEG
jgi:hypothetical protein